MINNRLHFSWLRVASLVLVLALISGANLTAKEREHVDVNEREHGSEGEERQKLMKLRQRLGNAVKAGKLSEEDAKARWQAMSAKLERPDNDKRKKRPTEASSGSSSGSSDKAKVEGKQQQKLTEVRQRLGKAVKEGLITEEQAKGRWESALARMK